MLVSCWGYGLLFDSTHPKAIIERILVWVLNVFFNRFFTYVNLEDDSEFVDLIEYHPCTNLESYLLEDKQALENVLFED